MPEEGDVSAPPIMGAPPTSGLLMGGNTFTVPGLPVMGTPPPMLAQKDEILDCSFLSGRVELDHPGADKLLVSVESLSDAIGAGVLAIKTGVDIQSASSIGTTITSTGSTQNQAELGITGRRKSFVVVTTVQANLLLRVKMTAMKS